MNSTATIEKMQQLKFYGMISAYHSAMETGLLSKCSSDELVAHLINSEWEDSL